MHVGGLLAVLLVPLSATRAHEPPAQPAMPSNAPSPLPLPVPALHSPHTVDYTIEARLDAAHKTIEGHLVLAWRNTSDKAVSSFPFHLYWNAFRNNLSTSARGEGPRAARFRNGERDFGYTEVRSVKWLGATEADLTPSLRYRQPDDENKDDRTIVEVSAPAAVAPGESARFSIEWTSRVPYGSVGRAGWVHDYYFIVQWFPKIGVLQDAGWNAHQFHSTTEFFADYGSYDVRLTLPAGFVVGATGALTGTPTRNADGTQTVRFHQDDVHDFAWTASPRFLERRGRFEEPGRQPVDIRLLVQPEHVGLADRYIEATRIALRHYGAWSADYPYGQLTVVDPAWGSASGGMEYPTLFTGGAHVWAPQALQGPEAVTIHECGHQCWYGLVGNNEAEEAWLDEGVNQYFEAKIEARALGHAGWGRRYFGGRDMRGRERGWPVLAPGVLIGRGEDYVSDLRDYGASDAMRRPAWRYLDPDSYYLNGYRKPALTLQTLEAFVGEETLMRVFQTYARRFRFAHPTTADFIATVNEVTGKDYQWFFDETWFSSERCDYAVEVKNEAARRLQGFRDGPDGGLPVLVPSPEPAKTGGETGPYDSVVTVRRLGGVRMPMEVLVEFADGRSVRESWDGQYRWTRFTYHSPAKVSRAVVDPDRRLAIDVDPANNSWLDEQGASRQAASKWSARFLLWLQDLLEWHALLA